MQITKLSFVALLLSFPVLAASEGTNILTPMQGVELNSTQDVQTNSFLFRAVKLKNNNAIIWSAACCKVCKKGKACGNSCIKRSYTCRKGVGCACDG